MHYMQQSQDSGVLLTAVEVQRMLNIDRSTVYRMAEDGRLPAIRVGRSWRFPAQRIQALLASPATSDLVAPTPVEQAATETGAPAMVEAAGGPMVAMGGDRTSSAVDPVAAGAAVEVASDLLGVMMLVTDMHGQPLTPVTNPCQWFAKHGAEPEVLDSCVAEWRDLADHPDLTPQFQPGDVGFECARAFIRNGTALVGMVLAGGVSPSADETVDPDLYHLDETQRRRVLAALPRIAAAISTTTPLPAAPTPATPVPGAAPKEN
jgi:excisionase family DNA binding protein